MTLPAGMVGDGQPDWGEDGCDSLDDPREGEGKWEGRKRCYQRVDKATFLLQSYAATCIKNCDQTLLGRLFSLEFYCQQPPFSVYFLRKF